MAVDYETALLEFIKQLDYKKMSKAQIRNEKRWFTDNWNRARKHETKQLMIKWFIADRQAKFFVGAALGAGAALAGSLLGDMMNEFSEMGGAVWPENPEENQVVEVNPPIPPGVPAWFWLGGPGGLVALGGALMGLDPISTATQGPSPVWNALQGGLLGGSGPLGFMPNLMIFSGLTFSGMCVGCLVFESIFSGTDLGELAAGVGEIIPF